MSVSAQNLKYERAPLIYVSYRLVIGLTKKGHEALSTDLRGLCEGEGFVVSRKPLPHSMFMVDNNTVSQQSEHSYCFFTPGEQTQFIFEPTPESQTHVIKLNTSEYTTYEDFKTRIDGLRNVLLKLDDNVTLKQLELIYLDASVPAPGTTIGDYVNGDHIDLTRLKSKGRLPAVTHIERYPAYEQKPESIWQFSALPFPDQSTKNQFGFFPDELVERSEYGMKLILPVPWQAAYPDDKPAGAYYWVLVTRALKTYKSDLLSQVDLLPDSEILKNECKQHFYDITASERTATEWGKVSKNGGEH